MLKLFFICTLVMFFALFGFIRKPITFILNKFSVRELIIEEFFKNVLFLLLHHLSGDCFGKK